MSGKRDRMDQLTFPDIVDNRPLEETDVAGELLRGSPPPLYARRRGCLYTADCLDFLRRIRSEAAAFVFADPPFDPPSVWDRTVPSDRYLDWSLSWIKESARILSPTGCLCICGPGELLADLKRPALAHFAECRLLVWYYRNRSHSGKDWGESYQNLLLLYKGNSHPMHTDLVRIPYEKHTIRYYQDRPGGTSRWRPILWAPSPRTFWKFPPFSAARRKRPPIRIKSRKLCSGVFCWRIPAQTIWWSILFRGPEPPWSPRSSWGAAGWAGTATLCGTIRRCSASIMFRCAVSANGSPTTAAGRKPVNPCGSARYLMPNSCSSGARTPYAKPKSPPSEIIGRRIIAAIAARTGCAAASRARRISRVSVFRYEWIVTVIPHSSFVSASSIRL